MNHFRKERLHARTFWEREVGKLSRPDRKGWALGNCPFHASKSKKSFSMNLENGAFFCFGCGVKGGDIIAYVALRDHLSQKEAAKKLGCFDDDGKPYKPKPGPLEKWLVMDFTIDGVNYQAAVKDEPKNELQLHRKFYAEAAVRLLEIRRGAPEQFEGEEEIHWGILSAAWELIQMEVGNG